MSDIQRRVEAEGRKIGSSISKASAPNDSHVKQYLKETERYYKDWDKAILKDREVMLSRIKAAELSASKELERITKERAQVEKAAAREAERTAKQVANEKIIAERNAAKEHERLAKGSSSVGGFSDISRANVISDFRKETEALLRLSQQRERLLNKTKGEFGGFVDARKSIPVLKFRQETDALLSLARQREKELAGVTGPSKVGGFSDARNTPVLNTFRQETETLLSLARQREKEMEQVAKEGARRTAVAQKAAQQAAYAGSSQAIYDAAGIKSPVARRMEVSSVKTSQKQMFDDLKAGNITLGQYNVLMGDAQKKLNLIESGNVRARGAFHKATAALASFSFELTGAIYGLTVLGGILAAPAIFGVNFLRRLEDSKMGMASILLSMGSLNGQTLTWSQAMGAANTQMDIMAKESINLAGKLDEFAATYRAILAPGLAAGMNLDQIRKIAIAGTVAVKTIGLDSRQIVQEIRDLVAGGIQAASSTLATSLGLTDRDIKAAKMSSEGLFVFLEKRLAGFVEGAKHRTETLSGKMEQLSEIVTQALGEASQGAFQSFKNVLDDIIKAVAILDKNGQFVAFRPEFVDTLKGYLNVLDTILTTTAKLVKFMWDFKEVLLAVAGTKLVYDMWNAGTKAMLAYKASLVGVIALERARVASAVISGGAISASQRALLLNAGAPLAQVVPALISKLKSVATSSAGRFGIAGIIMYGLYEAADYLGFFDTVESRIKRLKASMGGVADSTLDAKKAAAIKERERIKREGMGVKDVLFYNSKEAMIAEQTRIINEIEIEQRRRNKDSAVKETTDNIQRMDSALTNARTALQNLGSEYVSNADSIGKVSSAYRAYTDLVKETEKVKALPIVGTKEQQDNLRKRVSDYEKLSGQAKTAFELELKTSQLRKRVAEAKDTDSKERAEFELDKHKKLVPLLGAEAELRDMVNSATADADPLYMRLLKTLLSVTQAERKAVEESSISVERRKRATKDLVDFQEYAFKTQLQWNDKLAEAEAKRRVTYQSSKIEQGGWSDTNGIPVRSLDVTLPKVSGLYTSTEQLADNDIDAIRSAFNEDSTKLAFDYIDKANRPGAHITGLQDTLVNEIALLEKKRDLLIDNAKYQYTWEAGAADAFDTYNNAALNSAEHARTVWTTAFKGMEDALVSFVKTGKLDFRSLADSIISDLIRIQIQKTVAGMAGAIFGTTYGAINTTSGNAIGNYGPVQSINAHGNIFNQSGIHAFAKGGAFTNSIVSSPTLFPFAQGTGLMGEAGPEAIMPLTRTTSGDLGVRAVGGGSGGDSTVNNISVSVQVNADGSSKTSVSGTPNGKALGDAVANAVAAELIKHKRPGGLLSGN
jgi:hypothetical protein